MDTQTVLEIIKMIDARANKIEKEIPEYFIDPNCKDADFPKAGVKHLRLLSKHLQSFIEGQLNAAENQSTEQ